MYPRARGLHARYLMLLSLIQQVLRRLRLACQSFMRLPTLQLTTGGPGSPGS